VAAENGTLAMQALIQADVQIKALLGTAAAELAAIQYNLGVLGSTASSSGFC